MVKETCLSAAAISEMADTAKGFELVGSGMGQRFLDSVDLLLPTIAVRPSSHPRLRDVAPDLDVRWARLAQFPVSLLFIELDEEIRILGVAHSRRDLRSPLPMR